MSQVIRNEEIYIEELNKSGTTRYELNEIHWKEMNLALKLFGEAFDSDKKDMIFTKNMLYYKGGYPSEKTPPRLWTLFNHLSIVMKYFSYANKLDEIEPYLNEFGLNVSLTNLDFFSNLDTPIDDLNKKAYNKVKKIYNELFRPDDDDELNNMLKRDLFDKILNFMMEKQYIICTLSDSVKFEAADKVEEECDIKPVNFKKAVLLKYKVIKNGDITEDLAKVDENIDNMEAAISVLKE